MQSGYDPRMTIPLIKVTRGDVIEAVHRGALAVVDSAGQMLAQAGDPNWVVSMRSSAKPDRKSVV